VVMIAKEEILPGGLINSLVRKATSFVRLMEARAVAGRIAETHPLIEEVILFGSAVRGKSRIFSDIDILVARGGVGGIATGRFELDEEVIRSIRRGIPLSRSLLLPLHITVLPESDLNSEGFVSTLIESVREDGIKLWRRRI